ncbi:MAG: hypothetical protein HRT99_03850 [Mycoplasmatales bacterium]|nr:hypothetical protein [Mycoplasmatales bacterium]
MKTLTKLRDKFSAIATWTLIIAISLGVTGGAAMALDSAVTHQSFGIVAFALPLLLSFIWIVSSIVSTYVKSYEEMRGGEAGRNAEFLIKFSLGLLSIIITIIALAIH